MPAGGAPDRRVRNTPCQTINARPTTEMALEPSRNIVLVSDHVLPRIGRSRCDVRAAHPMLLIRTLARGIAVDAEEDLSQSDRPHVNARGAQGVGRRHDIVR